MQSFDITVFMDWFVTLMGNGVTTTFNILDSISFHQVSLLDFCLAMILVPTGVAIFIAISKVSAGAADLAYRGGKAAKKQWDLIDDNPDKYRM